MAVSLYQVAVDAHDPKALATFWTQVLDWQIVYEDAEEVVISRDADGSTLPVIAFLAVPEAKAGKNRLHFDITPDGDQQAEVDRIIALGARPADVGQGPDVTWKVLADTEGNEFCVLRRRTAPLD
ncbi:VOC family protein [Streptomyces sp. HSW2009]|uniref:VOC family protein n=1 Tax=Streptomyces sp. HSW2009 TaxID=3142890 RepID=UPI0032EAFCF3